MTTPSRLQPSEYAHIYAYALISRHTFSVCACMHVCMYVCMQDSPEERGARLVAAFTELAATSSTTIHPTSSSSQPSALLVSALAHCYDLAPALATALRSKRIALDEAQMDYLMALLGEHWAFALRQAMDGSGSAAAAGSGSAGGSSRMQGGAGPGPSSSGAASSSGFGERARAMDRTQLMSLVSQVRGCMWMAWPVMGYGMGFEGL